MKSALIVILLSLGLASGFEEKPQNVAGVTGSTLSMSCKGAAGEIALIWQVSNPVQPTQFSTLSAGSKYTISTSAGRSTLTINNVVQSDAVTYACRSVNSGRVVYAQVVVLGAAPSCTSDKPLNNLASGDTVTTTCSVNFYSATGYGPSISWFVVGGSPLSSTPTTTSNSVTSVYSEAIQCSFHQRQYQVDAAFSTFQKSSLPDQSWDHAENAASYAYRYTSTAMTVLCRLTSATIAPKTSSYRPGDKIKCEANAGASPSVNYVWTAKGESNSGQTLTIPSDLANMGTITATCTATQTSMGQSFTATDSHSFEVTIVNQASAQYQLKMSLVAAILVFHILKATVLNV